MTRLSGQQSQALVWVAYRDGVKPTRRALKQLQDMELVTPPTARDANYRLTHDGGQLLRKLGLARQSTNMQMRSLSRPRVA